jgi:hypothetical protein
MDKNYNINMDNKHVMEELTEAFGDAAVEMTFREVVKGMDSFFGLMGMTVELAEKAPPGVPPCQGRDRKAC